VSEPTTKKFSRVDGQWGTLALVGLLSLAGGGGVGSFVTSGSISSSLTRLETKVDSIDEKLSDYGQRLLKLEENKPRIAVMEEKLKALEKDSGRK